MVFVVNMLEIAKEHIAYFDGYSEYRKETAEFMRDVLLQMEEEDFDQERFDELLEQNSDDAHRNADTKKMARMAAIDLNRTDEEREKIERIREEMKDRPFPKLVPTGQANKDKEEEDDEEEKDYDPFDYFIMNQPIVVSGKENVERFIYQVYKEWKKLGERLTNQGRQAAWYQ